MRFHYASYFAPSGCLRFQLRQGGRPERPGKKNHFIFLTVAVVMADAMLRLAGPVGARLPPSAGSPALCPGPLGDFHLARESVPLAGRSID